MPARIGHFIDWYNFQRVHSGIDGLVPAHRYFQAAAGGRATLKERVAGNALELAHQGLSQTAARPNRPGRRPELQPARRGRAGVPHPLGETASRGAVLRTVGSIRA